ncbi:MAG: mRNA interferase YafQ [Candidatus Anoxychlamydiales bacterium]|nr:mRNA interferase YafQ [Candidatus Anoxychlamydiales bacterium]
MKLKIQTHRIFEKDAKKMKKRGKDLSKLKMILNILSEKILLPERYRNHKLVGIYRGYWELHIEPDWLLIYKKTKTTLILDE